MVNRLKIPFQIATSGALVCLPQDSEAEIAQSVALLLATPPGDRRSEPDYGLTDPLGRGLDATEVETAVAEWEDRADPATIEAVLDQVSDGLVNQQVNVYPATQES
jgi:phage baseplate assembly protein W